jgi:hypothetical protein
VLNFLLCTWFLWIGFYNFHLGVVVMALLAGYYVRHVREMNAKRALLFGVGFIVLFFTHVLPLGLMLITVAVVWTWAFAADLAARRTGPPMRSAGWTSLAALPALALCVVFLGNAMGGTALVPNAGWAWNNFPMHAFAGSRGRTGEQAFLVSAMLFYLVAGALAMRRTEWSSARGALFVMSAVSFVLYLLLPNAGFGGDEIKIRLAWVVFVFGCIAASTVERMRAIGVPAAVYVAVLLSASLVHAYRHNVAGVSSIVEQYTRPLEQLPERSTFVRVRFPAEQTRVRFGMDIVALEPLFHADALVAAQRNLVALTDYQALSDTFPVTLHPSLPPETRTRLWDLEGTSPNAVKSLYELLANPPVPIGYVVLLGDGTPANTAEQYRNVRSHLDTTMQLFAADSAGGFVRVYKRLTPAAQ